MNMKCTALSFLMGGLVGAAAVMATVPGTKTFMKRTMRKGKRAQYVVIVKSRSAERLFASCQNAGNLRKTGKFSRRLVDL